MSQADIAHAPHHAQEELGFLRKYIFSIDHKMIGKQYLTLGLLMAVIGGAG